MVELTYHNEHSAKFWRATVDQERLMVIFGRIGTPGQSLNKSFPSEAHAVKAYHGLVCEKLAKGYKPTTATMQTLFATLSVIDKPEAIASLFVGEHITEPLADDFCSWLTCCLIHHMPARQFRRVWQRLMVDQDDDELTEALGMTGKDCWPDCIGPGEGEVDDLYATAQAGHATHFLWYNNNCYLDIVALKGDPGAEAIERCVYGQEYHERTFAPALGPGAPIAAMYDDEAVLRDGTRIMTRSHVVTSS